MWCPTALQAQQGNAAQLPRCCFASWALQGHSAPPKKHRKAAKESPPPPQRVVITELRDWPGSLQLLLSALSVEGCSLPQEPPTCGWSFPLDSSSPPHSSQGPWGLLPNSTALLLLLAAVFRLKVRRFLCNYHVCVLSLPATRCRCLDLFWL